MDCHGTWLGRTKPVRAFDFPGTDGEMGFDGGQRKITSISSTFNLMRPAKGKNLPFAGLFQ
jgi:hypothetical protein